EYITTKGPASLGGQLFSFSGAPNRYGLPPFYELHVGLEGEPARRFRGHESRGELRARVDEVTLPAVVAGERAYPSYARVSAPSSLNSARADRGRRVCVRSQLREVVREMSK